MTQSRMRDVRFCYTKRIMISNPSIFLMKSWKNYTERVDVMLAYPSFTSWCLLTDLNRTSNLLLRLPLLPHLSRWIRQLLILYSPHFRSIRQIHSTFFNHNLALYREMSSLTVTPLAHSFPSNLTSQWISITINHNSNTTTNSNNNLGDLIGKQYMLGSFHIFLSFSVAHGCNFCNNITRLILLCEVVKYLWYIINAIASGTARVKRQ